MYAIAGRLDNELVLLGEEALPRALTELAKAITLILKAVTVRRRTYSEHVSTQDKFYLVLIPSATRHFNAVVSQFLLR